MSRDIRLWSIFCTIRIFFACKCILFLSWMRAIWSKCLKIWHRSKWQPVEIFQHDSSLFLTAGNLVLAFRTNFVFKGSMTHLQNSMGVLKRNKVIVAWNDCLWWQTLKLLNLMLFGWQIFNFLKSFHTEQAEKLKKMWVTFWFFFFLTWKVLSSKTFTHSFLLMSEATCRRNIKEIWGPLHKAFTWDKVNGKIMLTGVFRFYPSFFFSGKVLCNRPLECLQMCRTTVKRAITLNVFKCLPEHNH